MATSPTVTRIPQLDVQFAPGSAYDPVKLQRMVQALNTVISQVTNQNSQIAAIAAEESGGVAKHVFATEQGLGPDHTVAGLVPGNVVVALTETTAAFAALHFAQLAQVDENTFATPAQGDVITFVDGFWSAVPSNPLNLTNPGRNALVVWDSTDGGAAGNYAFAFPDSSLILTPGGLSVNQGAIVHANLSGLQFVAGSDTLIANDHPQYAMLGAANTWPEQQTFQAGIISQSDIDVFGNIEQSQAEPEWRIQNTDDTTDEGTWRMHAEPGQLIFSSVSDDGSDGENWLCATRIGEIVDAVNISANSFTFNGDAVWTDTYVVPGENVYFTEDSFGRRVINSATPGSGAGSLTLTDGTNTVAGTTQITVSGGTVGGSTPNATLTISGGGGGSSPFNVDPDTHRTIPTGVGLGPNDEFETGSSIDTSGTRYSGATPWAAFNITTDSDSVSGGSLVFLPALNPVLSLSGFVQAVPSGPWTYQAKITTFNTNASALLGLILGTSSGASGNLYSFNLNLLTAEVQSFSNATNFVATVASIANATGNIANPTVGPHVGPTTYPLYMQIAFDMINLTFSFSLTGFNFVPVAIVTAASFLGAPGVIGIAATLRSSVQQAVILCDWFRRIA